MAQSVDNVALFANDDTSVTGVSIRREIPTLTPIDARLQVVTSTHPAFLAFLALQVKNAGKNKALIIRMIASAVMHIFKDDRNMTGSTAPAEQLTGLEILDAEETDDATVINTNIEGGALLTAGDLAIMADVDGDEIASYFGVLFLAGVKRRTDQNREAFISKRAPAIQALVIGSLKLFNAESNFLTDLILDSAYASFNSMQLARSHLVRNTAGKMGRLSLGAQVAFTGMFMLLENQGMGSLKIIKEAAIRYSWFRTSFPELRGQFAAAQKGQAIIMRAVAAERPFLKAIYGNVFVPVAQSEIDNLLGVAKNIMSRVNPNYNQFGGGTFSVEQEIRINALLATAAETADETAMQNIQRAEGEAA